MIEGVVTRSTLAFASALMAVSLLSSAPVWAQRDSSSSHFVTRLNISILGALSGSDDSAAQAHRLCRDLSAWALDLESMMRSASAGAWERMSPSQRKAYGSAFRDRVLRDCTARAAGYLRTTIELAGVRTLPTGDRLIATRSTGDPFAPALMWQARFESGGALKVTDLLVNGRSTVLSAREAAGLVLERHSGDVGALIESLAR